MPPFQPSPLEATVAEERHGAGASAHGGEAAAAAAGLQRHLGLGRVPQASPAQLLGPGAQQGTDRQRLGETRYRREKLEGRLGSGETRRLGGGGGG